MHRKRPKAPLNEGYNYNIYSFVILIHKDLILRKSPFIASQSLVRNGYDITEENTIADAIPKR
ncbi:MAG: hypothetical protein AAF600_17505 [Bacteroidota bacterium]